MTELINECKIIYVAIPLTKKKQLVKLSNNLLKYNSKYQKYKFEEY